MEADFHGEETGGGGGVADAEARGLPHPRGAPVPGGAAAEEGGRAAGAWRRREAPAAQGRLLPAAGPRVPVRARAAAEACGLQLRVTLRYAPAASVELVNKRGKVA